MGHSVSVPVEWRLRRGPSRSRARIRIDGEPYLVAECGGFGPLLFRKNLFAFGEEARVTERRVKIDLRGYSLFPLVFNNALNRGWLSSKKNLFFLLHYTFDSLLLDFKLNPPTFRRRYPRCKYNFKPTAPL